jgi:hypothetical protein
MSWEDLVEEGRPSVTAMTVAMARAAHLLWGDPPKIFEDTFALRSPVAKARLPSARS